MPDLSSLQARKEQQVTLGWGMIWHDMTFALENNSQMPRAREGHFYNTS